MTFRGPFQSQVFCDGMNHLCLHRIILSLISPSYPVWAFDVTDTTVNHVFLTQIIISFISDTSMELQCLKRICSTCVLWMCKADFQTCWVSEHLFPFRFNYPQPELILPQSLSGKFYPNPLFNNYRNVLSDYLFIYYS